MPDRILRQYASIFFFAPLVRFRLDRHDFGLSEGDKKLIRSSIYWGYITFALGVSFLVASMMILFWDGMIRSYLYRLLMGITMISLGIGVWLIHHPRDHQTTEISPITNHMLLAFLPGYNRYLRYSTQDHHKPYRWLKESILWRYVIMVCLLFPGGGWMGILVLALMIIRIVILSAGYDLLSNTTKNYLNTHYIHHASERWSHISAVIVRIRDKRPHHTIVQEHRADYCLILSPHLRQRPLSHLISYGLLIGIFCIFLSLSWISHASIDSLPLLFWGIGLWVTYISIRYQYGGLGPVPVLHPLVHKVLTIIKHT